MSYEPIPEEHCQHDFYDGFDPRDLGSAFKCSRLDVFRPEDGRLFWPLDFHYPRGFVPLSFTVVADGPVWGTQISADATPLPTSRGLQARMVGPHLYVSEIQIEDAWEVQMRAEKAGQTIPAFLGDFPRIWDERVRELETWLHHLEAFDLTGADLSEIGDFYGKSIRFLRRAWEIHFEVMYPLVANYVGFYGLCSELNIDPNQIGRFLQGYDTKIMETDRELWGMTRRVRDLGLEDLFAVTAPADIARELASAGPDATQFLEEFDRFLDTYGRRSEGLIDLTSAPWIEDPTSPLGSIKTFLLMDSDHDFEQANREVVAEREEAIAQARSRLTVEELEQFDAALASCQHANFNWWNEEHNFYIDLRAHLPVRRAAVTLAEAVGAESPDDALFLFGSELDQVLRRERKWSEFGDLISARRAYFREWSARRADMPKMLGSVPDEAVDPVMKEVFGMGEHFFAAVSGTPTDVLKGVPAATGTAEGPARVLFSADDLHTVMPGEILVCEATSPNWTPAFAKIAACVCDSGGTLTHASIVSREYRIPCVTGVAVATKQIRTGDQILVNGTTGEVTLLDRLDGEDGESTEPGPT